MASIQHRETIIKTLTCFLFVSLLSSPALAFTLLLANIKGYSSDPVTIQLNANCSADVGGVLDAAVDFWNAAPHSGLVLNRIAGTSVTLASAQTGAFNANILVYCSSSFAADTGDDPNSILGLGTAADFNRDGPLDKGLLIVNTDSSGAASFQNSSGGIREFTLIHEIGHTLGLGHTEEPGAIMYFSTGNKTEAFLHQDDIDAIRHLYPQDELGGDYFLGCALVDFKTPRPPQKPLWPMALFAILPLLLALRLRQNTLR